MLFVMSASLAVFQSTPSVGRATTTFESFGMIEVVFQSTPSVGRATKENYVRLAVWVISIHALRGEGDKTLLLFFFCVIMISIHALRGEGDVNDMGDEWDKLISIHALRGEGDYNHSFCFSSSSSHFNPRPPWGGRPKESRKSRMTR